MVEQLSCLPGDEEPNTFFLSAMAAGFGAQAGHCSRAQRMTWKWLCPTLLSHPGVSPSSRHASKPP
eukprot:COSAG06_NODE_784_length_12328_cov_4.921416_6_plen_66_part_00